METRPQTMRALPGGWAELGSCKTVKPDTMYPSRNTEDQRKAVGICLSCPVIEQCLQHALKVNERWGTWGGLGQLPRRQLRNFLSVNPGLSLLEATRRLGIKWSPGREHLER